MSSPLRPWRRPLHALPLGLSLLGLYPLGCFPGREGIDGSCRLEPDTVLDCRAPGYDGELLPAGLVGYSCTGSMRPDLEATYREGVPDGLLCSARGVLDDSGREGYCCTSETVDCAYDPAGDCEDPGTYAYRCWGSNRPESLNPDLRCSNGFREGDIVNYCCAERTTFEALPACSQSDVLGCPQQLQGFQCQGDRLPRGEDLGPNKSRANYYRPTCATAIPAPNPEIKIYCCYMPALVAIGGTCVNHTKVPGCAPGRFGFACYGPDTPEDDYLPMKCPEPGFAGSSAEGYPATLYCCDFDPE